MANIGKNWNFEEASVDSLKVRIPLQKVTVLQALSKNVIEVDADTGEIDGVVFKKVAKTIEESGIKVRYAHEKQVTDKQILDEFVTVGLPAKVLKQNYFQGFTLDNIRQVYDYIISQEVVSFSLEDFLSADCTDVDFKKDTKMTRDELIQIIQECKRLTKPSADSSRGYKSFEQKKNTGIQWSDRRTTNFKSNPYVKIYHKEIELLSKSNQFATEFLSGIDYSDKVRVEVTIKNRQHFKKYGIEDTSFRSVLAITSDLKDFFISTALKVHLEPRVRSYQPRKGLAPMDAILVNMIQQCMERGQSWRLIRMSCLDTIENQEQYDNDAKEFAKVRKAKYRAEKKLDELYSTYILNTPYDKFTKKLDETFGGFFKWLGFE